MAPTVIEDLPPPVSVGNFASGERPLERRCVAEVSVAVADRKAEQALQQRARQAKVPGFRRNAKVVPPRVRQQWWPAEIRKTLYSQCRPAVSAKLQEEGKPHFDIMLIDYERQDDKYLVTMAVECQPDIPAPKLEGLKMRKPVPDIDEAAVEKVVERIRRQRAKWIDVERPAAAGDRVTYRKPGAEQTGSAVIGDPRVPPQLSQALTGLKPGEQGAIQVKGREADEGLKLEVVAVAGPELPPLDLEFARGLFPEVGSLETFREQIKEELQRQALHMATGIMINRAAHALDQATAEFELPGMLLQRHLQERLAQLDHEARAANTSRAEMGVTDEGVRERLRAEMRVGMLMGAYATRTELRIEAGDLDDEARRQAQQAPEPQAFMQQLVESEQLRQRLADQVLRGKIAIHLYGQVEAEEVAMSLQELEDIVQGGDPETRAVPAPPAESKA